MSFNRYSQTDIIQQIDHIEFGIWGNNEIRKNSVIKSKVGINVLDLYDNLEPKKDGLIDLRMGTTDNSIDCATCGLNSKYCVGHFGHIELSEPVYHIEYIKFVQKILSCICLRCSKVLMFKLEDEVNKLLLKPQKVRLVLLREIIKNVKYCQKEYNGCGAMVTNIKIDSNKLNGEINIISETVIIDETNKKKIFKHVLKPKMIYNILQNINERDCMLLGLNPSKSRPENLICKILPVPPIQIRPSTRADYLASSTKEDDLTQSLSSIVKTNIWLLKNNSDDNPYVDTHLQLLQYYVATYINNETSLVPKSETKGKVTKSLTSRFKGKHARFRGNLMGKRVDVSGRTVISSDPTISINELGVPITIAMNLTFPETVTPYNIEKLQQLVRNGRDVYPGANYVIPVNKQLPLDLRFLKQKYVLRYGDIVERHLVNGDYVLLNRQPSLHKQSMMGHKIKVLANVDYNTFRLSVGVTGPYNADFDGDEMNIFVPQSVQTQIELEEIADVQRQIINPKNSRTSIGLIQDGLIGSYNLTFPDVKIDWKNTMNIMGYTNYRDVKNNFIKKNKSYTGHEILSMIVPTKVNIKKGGVSIINGVVEKGQIAKDVLGEGKQNSIQQIIWDEYDVDATRDFLDNAQRLTNNYNLYNGFTIGIGDIQISKDIDNQIKVLYDTKDRKVEYLITEIENNPSLMTRKLFEENISSELNVIRDEVSSLISNNSDPHNALYVMSKSGSKGNANNTGQICGCVGLQVVEGKMIQRITNNRTLPYYFQNDDRSSARGLIKHSFYEGLFFSECIYQLMAAREGIISTAVKTATTGYIQRKLIKSMEDISIKYDKTVRSGGNVVIQFIYGDTGTDTTRHYEYKLELLELGDSEIADKHKIKSSDLNKFDITEKLNNEFYNEILELRDTLRLSQYKSRMQSLTLNTTFVIPVNLLSIAENAKNSKNIKDNLTATYIINELHKVLLYEHTPLMCMNNSKFKLLDEQVAKTSFKIALYDIFSPARVLYDYKLSKQQFDEAIKSIKLNFIKNIAEPGEMVGIIGSQSMGEPATQMTLDAFHKAGIGAISKLTGGIPRLQELISVTKNIKTPQMTVILKHEIETNQKKLANKVASHLKYTTIQDIRKNINIYWDPNIDDEFSKKDNVTKPFAPKKSTKNSCQSDLSNLPWLMRIELDRYKMFDKEVTLLDIKSKFCNFWEKRYVELKTTKKEEKNVLDKINRIAILSNNDNDIVPVIHIRFDMTVYDKYIMDNFVDYVIDTFKLKGIKSIKNIDGIEPTLELSFDNKDNKLQKGEQHIIYTSGVNLEQIRYFEGIDIYKTICNDVNQIYNNFGIEAARAVLCREYLYTYEREGAPVNYHHLSVLVDLMTLNGSLSSLDRHGMNKTDKSPLSKASFEKSTEHMVNAAILSEIDQMKSVSSRIMAGLVIKGGTGMCGVMLDTDMIQNSEFTKMNYMDEQNYQPIMDSNINKQIIEQNLEEDLFMPE